MASSFLSGLVVGAVLSALALSAASLVTSRGAPAPRPAILEMPAGSEFNRTRDDTAARLPQTDVVPGIAGVVSLVDSGAPDDLSAVSSADRRPVSRPVLGTIETDLSAPQMANDASGMSVGMAEPVAAPVQGAAALEAPESAASEGGDADQKAGDPAISADPAQPSPPDIESGVGLSINEGIDSGANLSSAGTEAKTAASNNRRAIDVHAADFDAADGKPLMAIVLIDAGASPVLLQALEGFAYPLSFAIDATMPEARELMRRHRDAGFEVLAIADLPEGAEARDTETVMQAVFATIPEAVGVLEGSGAGLQASHKASAQLAAILGESGHGLVLFSKGLQTAPTQIARAGVPVGTILRDLDSDEQDAEAIRRALDQAAFTAGRREGGGVILLGHLRAETIGALLLWGMQERAQQVALVPVSAVLRAGD